MDTSRRSFLKLIMAGGALTAGALASSKFLGISSGSIKTTETIDQSEEDMKYPNPNRKDVAFGMIIDLDKCKGCNYGTDKEAPCTKACRSMHNVPPDMDWIKIYHKQDNPFDAGHFFPRVCMQCENPPCRNVCPVGAALRRDDGDGLVLINHEVCIGCRLCMAACPYETRYFNWADYDEPDKSILKLDTPMYVTKHDRGVTDKCDFCAHLGYKGQIAKCASACEEGALYYGNLKENAVTNSQGETLDVKKTVSERGGYRYKEELGTKPRVYYLPVRS